MDPIPAPPWTAPLGFEWIQDAVAEFDVLLPDADPFACSGRGCVAMAVAVRNGTHRGQPRRWAYCRDHLAKHGAWIDGLLVIKWQLRRRIALS